MQSHILEEWRIRDVEQKADRAVSRIYELDSLRSDVASLERTVRENSSVVDGLRYELETAARRIDELTQMVMSLQAERDNEKEST